MHEKPPGRLVREMRKVEKELQRYDTQDELRDEIQAKLLHCCAHGSLGNESEENIILVDSFDQLRRGIIDSKRVDAFAVEVFETSALFCIMAGVPSEYTCDILNEFVPSLYIQHDSYLNGESSSSSSSTSTPSPPIPSPDNRTPMAFIRLLYLLFHHHPLQYFFYEALRDLTPDFIPPNSPHHTYLIQLARALYDINYIRLDKLLRLDAIPFTYVSPVVPSTKGHVNPRRRITPETLLAPFNAVVCILHRFRSVLRDRSWVVLRSAYRHVVPDGPWLSNALLMADVFKPNESRREVKSRIIKWLKERTAKGEIVRRSVSWWDVPPPPKTTEGLVTTTSPAEVDISAGVPVGVGAEGEVGIEETGEEL